MYDPMNMKRVWVRVGVRVKGLFWLVTQSFLPKVGKKRLRDEPKERLRGRLGVK